MKRKIGYGGVFVACLMAAAVSRIGWSSEKVTTVIQLSGCRIKPADQVTLSVNQSGVLGSVPREGDLIDAGQRVILLEDDLARASLAVAEKEAVNDVDIRHAQTASEVTRLEHEQAIQVNKTSEGTISQVRIRSKRAADRTG
jgi:hypothetical protein